MFLTSTVSKTVQHLWKPKKGYPMKSKIPDSLFGKELERLRQILSEESGEMWSQKKVTEGVGVTTQAYQNWIHGRRGKNIDVATIKKLSDVLKGDFRGLVKLARPDILKLIHVVNHEKVTQKINKKVDYPTDVVYISGILTVLHDENKKEFNKIKRIINDFYPDIAEKIKKRTKRK